MTENERSAASNRAVTISDPYPTHPLPHHSGSPGGYGAVLDAGQTIDPFVCPRGHHSITVSRRRFCCYTCRKQGQDTCSWSKSELVDLRDEEPPLAHEDDPGVHVDPFDPPAIDEIGDRLYYTSGKSSTKRRLHVTEDCPRAQQANKLTDCPLINPPGRLELCATCAPGVSVERLQLLEEMNS